MPSLFILSTSSQLDLFHKQPTNKHSSKLYFQFKRYQFYSFYFQNAHGKQMGQNSFYLRNQLFTHIRRGVSAIQVVVYTLNVQFTLFSNPYSPSLQ